MAKLDRPSHGTTIVVINLFYNMPVRQKRLQHALEIESIRNELQAIALIYPQVRLLLLLLSITLQFFGLFFFD